MKKTLVQLCAATSILLLSFTANAQQYWKLTGNAGTTTSNFLGTTDNQSLQFYTNNKLRMIVKNAGNVGIGTTITPAKFNIDGGTNVSLINPGYQVIGKVSGYNLAFDPFTIQGRNDSGALSISINPFGGSVYLGNLSNSYYGAVASGYSYGMYASTSSGTGVYGYSSAASGVIGYSSGGGDNGRGLNGFGNYGVYATTFDNSTYYAGYFAGDVITSGVYSSSDEKLKQNIKEFSSAIDIIRQLHPKTYQYRQDGNYKLMNLPQGQHYGLIAQEVEKVLPGMVKNSKFDVDNAAQNVKPVADAKHPEAEARTTKSGEVIDFKAVNYTEMIPLLIKGMQEQQQTIQDLQQTVAQQQEQINKLLAANALSSKAVDNNITGAGLLQNAPNPFSSGTVIRCNVPATVKQAQLQLYNANGTLLKTYTLNNKGVNNVTINGGTLAAGQYTYSLLIDGKVADSKNMILTK